MYETIKKIKEAKKRALEELNQASKAPMSEDVEYDKGYYYGLKAMYEILTGEIIFDE